MPAKVNPFTGKLDLVSDVSGYLKLDQTTPQTITNGSPIISEGIQFGLTSSETVNEGLLYWNSDDGTLNLGMPGGNVNLQIGQEQLIRVSNKTGGDLTNGQIVYCSGSQGNRPTIALAKADVHATGTVLGMLTEDIANNNNGYITTVGYVRGIDTTGGAEEWEEGDALWLSATTAGAATNVRPEAPNLVVKVGFVTNVHATEGSILLTPEISLGIEDLHDVNGTAFDTSGQILVWDNDNGYWDATKNINDYLTDAPSDGTTYGRNNGAWVEIGGVSFGTTTQIPYMNATGDDFLYSANFTFDGTNLILLDNKGIALGTGGDTLIAYDGTNLNINPKVVGSGYVKILGNISAPGTGLYSEIFGLSNTASGTFSLAFGYGNTSSNTGTIVIGDSSTASGSYSIVFGSSSNATGSNSMAIGTTANALATSAIAIGRGSKAGSVGTFAMGAYAISYGGTVVGTNSISGNQSVVVGGYSSSGTNTGSDVTGDYCIAIGNWTQNKGYDYSMAFGYYAKNTASHQLVFGGRDSSPGSYINEVYFGCGPENYYNQFFPVTINGGSGAFTDCPGGDLTIAGGMPTGAGVGGSLKFSTAPAGATGTTLRSRVVRTTIDSTGLTTHDYQHYFKDKIYFTQSDGNEYIDSLADGYMDYGATTGHRFDNNLTITTANANYGLYHTDGTITLATYMGTSGLIGTTTNHNLEFFTNDGASRFQVGNTGWCALPGDINGDAYKLYFGAGYDSYIGYDGADLVINPAEVGTGAVKTTSGRIVNTTRVTTTYQALVTDHVIFADTDGGAFTATLPAGVDGQELFITNCGSSGNALTVDGNGAETINGDATQLVYDGESVHLIFESTEQWRVM